MAFSFFQRLRSIAAVMQYQSKMTTTKIPARDYRGNRANSKPRRRAALRG